MNCLLLITCLAFYYKAFDCTSYSSTHQMSEPPYSLMTPTDLFNLQKRNLPFTEPIIAYDKLQNDCLELIGLPIKKEDEFDISFIFYIHDCFKCNEISFKYFRMDRSIIKAICQILKKLSTDVIKLSFEKCYFPEYFRIYEDIAFPHITHFQLKDCFVTAKVLKRLFIVASTKITNLTLIKVQPYPEESVQNSEELETFNYSAYRDIRRNIFLSHLPKYFPLLESLELNGFILTEKFDLSKFLKLEVAEFQNCSIRPHYRNWNVFPASFKRLILSNPYDYIHIMHIYRLLQKKIILDCHQPVVLQEYSKMHFNALYVFSFFHFNFLRMSDAQFKTMFTFIYNSKNEFKNLDKLAITMRLTTNDTEKTLCLIDRLPHISALEIILDTSVVESTRKIIALFDSFKMTYLNFVFRTTRRTARYDSDDEYSNGENFANPMESSLITEFVYEILKRAKTAKELRFIHCMSNKFLVNVLQKCKEKKLELPELDTLVVKYETRSGVSLMHDFLIADYFKVKIVKFSADESFTFSDDFTAWDKVSPTSIQGLHLYLPFTKRANCKVLQYIFKNMPKLQYLLNYDIPYEMAKKISFCKMKELKGVSSAICVPYRSFGAFFELFPSDLEEMKISMQHFNAIEVKTEFRKRFSTPLFEVIAPQRE